MQRRIRKKTGFQRDTLKKKNNNSNDIYSFIRTQIIYKTLIHTIILIKSIGTRRVVISNLPRLDLQPETAFDVRVDQTLLQFHRDGRLGADPHVTRGEDVAQQHLHLHHGEPFANALPLAEAEREVRPRIFDPRLGIEKPVRVEFVRILEVFRVPADRSQRDPNVHPGAEGERLAAWYGGWQLETLDAHPVQEREDGAEAHGLVDHGVHVFHPVDRVVGQHTVVAPQRLVDLLLQPRLHVRVLGEHLGQKGGDGGDGVETAEEEGERVNGYVLDGHRSRFPGTVRLVPYVHQQLQHVRSVGAQLLPTLDRLVDEVVEELLHVFLEESQAEQLGQPGHVPVDQHEHALLQADHVGPSPPVHVEYVLWIVYRVDGDAVHAAGYHVVGVSREQCLHLRLALVFGQHGQKVGESDRALGHQLEHTFDLARGEGRGEHVPVLLPTFPLHREQHAAEHGVGALVGEGTMIGEVIEILHRDRLDQVQVAEYYYRSGELVNAHVFGAGVEVVRPIYHVVQVGLLSDQRAHVS